MAITVEVRGNSGSGGSQVPPPNPQGASRGNQYDKINLDQYQPSLNGGSVMPSSNRIAEDIRREIQMRGIVMVPGTQNFSTMMNQMRQQQAQNLSASIDAGHKQGYASIDSLRNKAYNEVSDRIANATQNALQGITNPVNIKNIQEKYRRIESREYERIDKFFEPFYAQNNAERDNAKKTSEDELTKAIQQLTQEYQRGNSDSYVNGLRNNYREAIWKRDNANTKEEAEQFAKEAAEAQKRLGDISGMGAGKGNIITSLLRGGSGFSLAYTALDDITRLKQLSIQNQRTDQNLVSQTINGNVFGAIQADAERNLQNKQTYWSVGGSIVGGIIGGIGAAVSSLGIGTVAGAAGGAALGAGVGNKLGSLLGAFSDDEETITQAQLAQILQSNESKITGYNSLAMMTRGGGSISARRDALIMNTYPQAAMMKEISDNSGNAASLQDALADAKKKAVEAINISSSGVFGQNSDFSLYDLGYTAPEFAQVAAQRIAARGFGATNADAAIQRAFNADAMEKVFSLGSGSLNSLAQWDRYANTDYTQTFANLAATMGRLGTRGFSNGDYGRAGEYIGYQNQLMNTQLNQGFLTPNTQYATGQLATLQSVFGNSLNSQAISAYNRAEGSIQNPQGDMARVILYDVIKRNFNTGNNLSAIKRIMYSQDPNVRDKLKRLYTQRLIQTYGAPGTTSGDLNLGGIFGTDNPYMLDKVIKGMLSGSGSVSQGSVGGYAMQAKGWAAPITKASNKIADATMAQTASYQSNMTDMMNIMITKFSTKLDEIIKNLGGKP